MSMNKLVFGGMSALLLASMPLAAERAFLTHQAVNKVSVIQLEDAKKLASIDVLNGPVGVAIDKERNRFYVTHPEQGRISVIDLSSYEVVGEVKTGGQPFGIVADPSGKRQIFVSDWERNAVLVVNPESLMVVDLLSVGENPAGIALDNENRRLYIANRNSNTVSVLDADTPRGYATVPTGEAPLTVIA